MTLTTSDIKKYLYKYLPMSYNNFNEYQKAVSINEWKLDYFYKRNFYIDKNDKMNYKTNGLLIEVSSLNFKKNYRYKNNYVNMKPLLNCISSNYVYPFLLFINNKFIKWSDIKISTSYRYTYLYIESEPDNTIIDSIKIYNLPFRCKLYENISYPLPTVDKNGIPIEKIISFNNDGSIITDYETHNNISVLFILNENNRYIIDTGFFAANYSPFALYDNNSVYIMNDISYEYNITSSNVLFIHNGVIDNTTNIEVYADNTIKIDTENIIEIEGNGYIIVFDTLKNNNYNTIMKYNNIPKESIFYYIIENNSTESEATKILSKKFNISKDDEDFYASLADYDPIFYADLFKNDNDADIDRITTYNSISSKNSIPYGLDNSNKEMGLMIFKNGELQPYDIKDNSVYLKEDVEMSEIDLIRFKHIQNIVANGKTPSDETSGIELSEYFLDIDNIGISIKSPNDGTNSMYIYPIDDIYINIDNDEGSMRIDTDNKLYIEANDDHNYIFNRDCKFYTTNQFRYNHFQINKETIDLGYFLLPKDFDQCNNFDRYMVFYNGRLMLKSNYIITLYNKNKPYYNQRLYPLMKMTEGDTVDLFYIPYDRIEYVYDEELNITGDVIISDIDNLKAPLCKELSLIFINGRLISNDNISNITKKSIKILNSDSINHLIIISFIKYNDELMEYIRDNNSDMDNLYNELSNNVIYTDEGEYNEYNYYRGIQNESIIGDFEEDVTNNKISGNAAILSISRDFYNVTTTNISHHSFTNTIEQYNLISDGIDPGGFVDLKTYYGALEENYNIYSDGMNLVWKESISTNGIHRSSAVGKTKESTLSIFKNINKLKESIPVEYFNGETWSSKQAIPDSTSDNINFILCACGIYNNCFVTSHNNKNRKFNGASWSLLNNSIENRNDASVIKATNGIIIIGGLNSDNDKMNSTELINNTSSILDKNINISRNAHTSCGNSNAAIIIGGIASGVPLCEVFNGTVWTSSNKETNIIRDSHASNGVLNNNIVFGGNNQSSSPNHISSIVEVFDGNTWSILNTNIIARKRLGSSGVGMVSMIISGDTDDSTTNTSCEVMQRI